MLLKMMAHADVDASADWTKAISRGGIKLVNNKTYHFFHAVEMNV